MIKLYLKKLKYFIYLNKSKYFIKSYLNKIKYFINKKKKINIGYKINKKTVIKLFLI